MSLLSPPRRPLLMPAWSRNDLWRRAAAVPSLDLNFAAAKALGPLVTFTRASTATFIDSAGVLQTAATDVPRFDHNPTTGESLGLLVEESRTNSIRNNTMQGAVAGTPGTVPTNWSIPATSVGISSQIVGTGIENGIAYVDIRASGTTTGSLFFTIRPEGGTVIAAANLQTWTFSSYVKLAGGSLSNTSIKFGITGNDSAGTGIAFPANLAIVPTTANLISQRFTNTGVFNTVGIAYVSSYIQIEANSGAAIDITLRIGLPQLEQGAFATSVIPTTGTAATRSADVASITGSSFLSWYNQTNGTVYAEFAPAFQSSAAAAAANNPGAWGATQNGLGSFNGYGVRLNPTSNFVDNINGMSRYAPSGFSTQINIGQNAFLNLGQTYKTAFAWESSGIAGSNAGQAALTNTNPAAAAMGTHDQFYLGRQNIGGTPTQLNGYLRRLTYWQSRLPNSTLQAITL